MLFLLPFLIPAAWAYLPLATTPPLKVAVLVEPTPFNYISGYANRFKEALKFLREAGDQVHVVTADSDKQPPDNFLGFPITTNRGFSFPWYKGVVLTLDFAGSVNKVMESFRPDIIHVAAPGCLVFPAIAASRKFKIPLVMSYHTNVIEYTKSYFQFPGSLTIAKQVLLQSLGKADLLLCTSPQLKEDLNAIGLQRVDVWQKGINAEVRARGDDYYRQRLTYRVCVEVLSFVPHGCHAEEAVRRPAGTTVGVYRTSGHGEETGAVATSARWKPWCPHGFRW